YGTPAAPGPEKIFQGLNGLATIQTREVDHRYPQDFQARQYGLVLEDRLKGLAGSGADGFARVVLSQADILNFRHIPPVCSGDRLYQEGNRHTWRNPSGTNIDHGPFSA